MNYDYYRTFYYVGKHKSLSKAAAELYSSQPAISRTIQKLEAEMGCQLFIRGKTGVSFTHEGQTLFEYVSAAHNQLVRGEDEVSRSTNIESGTIYIGSTVTALHGFLFDFLDDFHLAHPSVKFKISTGSTNGTIEKLKNGTVDLAFVSTPYNTALTRTLRSTVIGQFNDILIAGNGFAPLRGQTLALADLLEYPFVCLRKGMQLRQFIDGIFEKSGLLLSPDSEADGADLLVPMVCHNFGLGFVPQSFAEDAIRRGEVFRIPLEQELPARQICLITDPHHPHTRASRELAKRITAQIQREPASKAAP